jgi:hypothetical protein
MKPSPGDPPTLVKTHVHWEPTVAQNNGWISPADGNSDIKVTLDATISTDSAGPAGKTAYTVMGSISAFNFQLLNGEPFIELTFSGLTFTTGSGQKTHVSPQLENVQFLGALSFLSELEKLLSFTGDGGGLSINIDGTGVHADLSVSIPPVGLGIFTLSGISFDARFDLPLDGSSPAKFTFAFASPDNPFTIAGGIFSGGGYFMIAIGTKHVMMIQVSLNFGALIELDVLVASARASLSAGITYTLSTDSNGLESCVLTAWVKFVGSFQLLGLITMSLEFDLVLQWDNNNGKGPDELSGTATIVLSLDLGCWHPTVHATAHKTFTNSGGGIQTQALIRGASASTVPVPTYADQASQTDWDEYCKAFEVD